MLEVIAHAFGHLPELAGACLRIDAGTVACQVVDVTILSIGRGFDILPDFEDEGIGFACLSFAVDPDVATTLECQCIPNEDAGAGSLFPFDAVAETMLGAVDIMHESILAD